MDHTEQEFALVKQSILDLREAAQVEASTREECVARLQNLIDDEARAREDDVIKAGVARESAENRLEQHLQTMMYEERALREDIESQLEAKAAAMLHELNFEKARFAAQGRELSQAVASTREALASETTARRNEVGAVTKSLEELRSSLTDETTLRERSEARLLEQIGVLDAGLRDEAMARELADRKAVSDRQEILSTLQKEIAAREDSDAQIDMRLTEERKLREEGDDAESKMREQVDIQQFAKMQQLIKEEAETREAGIVQLGHRVQTNEDGIALEKSEREERDRSVGARLAEIGEDIGEIRQKLRDALKRCEEIVSLREQLLTEKADRQAEETKLELAIKELRVSAEQAQQAAEQEERRLARLIGDLSEKLDGEVKDRSSGDADCAKAIASEREERIAAMSEEQRKLEEMVAKVESSLETALMEEQGQREAADATLDSKCLKLQQACDEAQKWRIEQYNELVLELSKVTEMLAEETKTRQLQDQTLAGEVSRLRQETVEEANSRKLSINGVRDEIRDVLERLEREREAWMAKEKERWQAITALKDEAIAESARRDTADETLRQLIDREVMQREEVLAGATRAWQKATIKTNEEWRASVRAETATREEAQLRLEQQLVEIRSAILETKAVMDQREEGVTQRFKAASEALAMEDSQRKSGEAMLEAAIAEVKRLLAIEKEERALGSQMNADNIKALEGSLRDETLIREELDRRTAKEALEIVERLQAEQASREDADMQLDQRILAEVQTREELLLTEIKTREEADASVMVQWQKAMRDEVVAREEDRKDLISRIQQNQLDNQVERDDRIKADRDLMAAVARLQSLQKEEEETRVVQGERLGAAVESLQEAVRTLGPQREEILAKCLEAVDQVRNLLSKEVVTRSAKEEMLQEAVRDVRLMISDETQAREAEA